MPAEPSCPAVAARAATGWLPDRHARVLAAPNRLTGGTEFRTAVRRGERRGGPLVVLHLLVTGEPTPPRVGFVVSRAVGNAVTRNLVKRRLRHLMRERLDVVPDGAVLVVRALPASAQAPYAALGAELDRALARWAGEERR